MYEKLPVFHRDGSKAYQKGLKNTLDLLQELGNPHKNIKCIHIAGTNGKGSSSHYLASILQEAGYNTGLYTSPHLKKFTERIKINGIEIEEEFLIQFINKYQSLIETIKPSFFELTVGLTFLYFLDKKVDIAVIETGLGGRLDSTNVIKPIASLITNIGLDHQDILGETLPEIAFEKCGIIKKDTPIIISERNNDTKWVFNKMAEFIDAPIFWAEDNFKVEQSDNQYGKINLFENNELLYKNICNPLLGKYQEKNLAGVLQLIKILNQNSKFKISNTNLIKGIENVILNTKLKGRWQKLGENPQIICDVGHNSHGFKEIIKQISNYKYDNLYMILGFSKEKDLRSVFSILPDNANYIFTKSSLARACETSELEALANNYQLKFLKSEKNVNLALEFAKKIANENDLIFIGGSIFVVGEIDSL